MSKKNGHHNGDSNGHDHQSEGENLIHFPSLAERQAKAREEKQKQDAWRKAYAQRKKAAQGPIFNFGKIPPFTGALIALLVVIHIGLAFLDPLLRLSIIERLGLIPSSFSLFGSFDITRIHTLFTYSFIHGSWMHLTMNALMMLTIGWFFELQNGAKRTIFIYACSILGGALFHIILPFGSAALVIGSSGGLSGLFGAALLSLNERANAIGQPQKLKKVVLIWLGIMLLMGVITGTAWQAHIGGFLTGLGLYNLIRKGKLKI